MANDQRNESSIECNADPVEEIEMLDLPVEIIRHILMYVDDQSRFDCALVCHTFYDLICELDRDKNLLDLCFSEVRLQFVSSVLATLLSH